MEMRPRSADLFRQTLADGTLPIDAQLNLKIRLIDVLRRAGEWADAIALADEVLAEPDLQDFQRSVGEFGRQAAERKDRARYTMGDVNKGGAQSSTVDVPIKTRPTEPRLSRAPARRFRSFFAGLFEGSPPARN
jgi:hypothetical protein